MNIEAFTGRFPARGLPWRSAALSVSSLGIPLPGEIALVSAAVLASQDVGINPVWSVSRPSSGDRRRLHRLHHRPQIRDDALRVAGRPFQPLRHRASPLPSSSSPAGVWAVFFGRFIALLRIQAGPLAGALRMRYPYFLAANASGAICWPEAPRRWCTSLGLAAEKWLSRFLLGGAGARRPSSASA